MYETIILTNQHREPLAVPHFAHKNPKIFISEDWEYTAADPNYRHGNEVGAYRCFRSHVEGIEMMTGDVALIMEDDCVPEPNSAWEDAIGSAYEMVTEYGYDAACLYLNPSGSHPKGNGIKTFANGFDWWEPKGVEWYVCAVIYMINREGAKKMIEGRDFASHRIPADLYLWQSEKFKWAAIDGSFFIHDRSQGSLNEKAK